MTTILAIDPGTTESGYVVTQGAAVVECGVIHNKHLLDLVRGHRTCTDHLAIEMIASQGMAVGKETFETCVLIGRLVQLWRDPDAVMLVYRQEVKLHICGSAKAKDGNVRQAIIDMYPRIGGGGVPQVGTKKQPGPLFGMSSHAWQALGVAIVADHKIKNPPKRRRAI